MSNLKRKHKCLFVLALLLGMLFLNLHQEKIESSTLGNYQLSSFEKNVNNIKGTPTEKLLNSELKKRHFIGTVTLVKNGHLVYQEGFGYANRAKNQKNSGNTTFQIASIQKGMTAMMLQKALLHAGISLDSPLSKFYPRIKHADQVSLRNLLTMTSGIFPQRLPKRIMNEHEFIQYTENHTKIIPSQIGTEQYQPVNFVLLVGIIEKLTGKNYYQDFKDMIQKPLHLKNTYSYLDMKQHLDQQAQGYHYNSHDPYIIYREAEDGYTDQLGTGNIYMSNGDLYLTLRAFVGADMLSVKETDDLYSNGQTDSSYVSGLYKIKQKNSQLIGKQYAGYHFHGAEFGFETIGDITKDGQTAVIFASNSADREACNNYRIDIPIYRSLINDDKIF